MPSSPQNCIFTDNYNRLMDDYFDLFIVSLVKIANGSSQTSQDRGTGFQQSNQASNRIGKLETSTSKPFSHKLIRGGHTSETMEIDSVTIS